jgi:hypothetical protein
VTRRSPGRGRSIIVVGALVSLAGCVPAWWTVGGTVTQAQSGNAFAWPGSGIVVFLAAIALLVLVVLPYATRDGEAGLDRPLSYVVLLLMAIGALAVELLRINGFGGLGLPDRAPGLWLTGAGLALLAWGVAELAVEKPSALP